METRKQREVEWVQTILSISSLFSPFWFYYNFNWFRAADILSINKKNVMEFCCCNWAFHKWGHKLYGAFAIIIISSLVIFNWKLKFLKLVDVSRAKNMNHFVGFCVLLFKAYAVWDIELVSFENSTVANDVTSFYGISNNFIKSIWWQVLAEDVISMKRWVFSWKFLKLPNKNPELFDSNRTNCKIECNVLGPVYLLIIQIFAR